MAVRRYDTIGLMKTMILVTQSNTSYELIDSGNERKLERYGDFVLSRPDPQAIWFPSQTQAVWNKSDAVFIREGKKTEWKLSPNLPKKWNIVLNDLTFCIRPTSFKHTGVFPEQSAHWSWMESIVKKEKNSNLKALNLFGYTGGATLALARAGVSVTHVDGSKAAVSWAKENAELSGLADKPIRFITDDVIAFLKREIRRGSQYDIIVMDPPMFGHGPSGELWKIEEQFNELLDLCKKVLSPNPVLMLISGYASGYSPISYMNSASRIFVSSGGTVECGELAIQESNTARLLPCGIFFRWSKG